MAENKYHEDLTEEELSKLAAIEADLIAASAKSDKEIIKVVAHHLKEAGFKGEDLQAFSSPDEMDKEAQGGKLMTIARSISTGLRETAPLIAAGMVLALGGSQAIGAIRERRALSGSLDTIKKQNPELRKDPMTDQHFNAIADFAPSLARNPVVAGSLLKKIKHWGDVDHKTIQDLVATEKNLSEIRRSKGLLGLARPAEALGRFQEPRRFAGGSAP